MILNMQSLIRLFFQSSRARYLGLMTTSVSGSCPAMFEAAKIALKIPGVANGDRM